MFNKITYLLKPFRRFANRHEYIEALTSILGEREEQILPKYDVEGALALMSPEVTASYVHCAYGIVV